ncbi:MAG: hypothetical protein ACFFBP_07315 [Promethearchaeota archaeon]
MIELKNRFFENLDYQIKLKRIEDFKKKLPSFKKKLQECDLAVRELREKFEEIRRRGTYGKIIDQINSYLENTK